MPSLKRTTEVTEVARSSNSVKENKNVDLISCTKTTGAHYGKLFIFRTFF